MKTKKTWHTVLLSVLLVLTLWFILGRSTKEAELSNEESLGLLALVRPILEFFVGKGNATNYLIRKIAHYCEFFLLGLELGGLCLLWSKPLLRASFAGLLVAMTDETMQLFVPGRTGQVQDVWLDFSGVLTAVLLAGCLGYYLNKRNNHERDHKTTLEN